MYHCHTQFYFIGREEALFAPLRAIPPLECFTHGFRESRDPEAEPAAGADLILADLRRPDAGQAVRDLIRWKRTDSELIVLAGAGQSEELSGVLSELADIWTLPMPEAELCFHFQQWQRHLKTRMDCWQAGQYLEAAINSSPNLIWYKDKNGIHEKVNDSFCRAVNKSKHQVQGRGHAYIWDVEQDDPACIESERIVMERQKTCVSEEIIQTGEGQRILTTYKSPLYDFDGTVMGTVGVAIDVTQERLYAQELIRKNQALETLFTSMDCGIMCHSVDGSRIISVNRAALEILGYDSQDSLELDGFNMIAQSVLDEDKSRLREKIASLKNPGDNTSVEYRVQHKDGKLLHVMGNIKLMQEDGELFYQRYLLDCTAQKLQAEKERQEAEKRQMELISALGIEYSLICCFNLDTGEGQVLRLSESEDENGALGQIFHGELLLEECLGRYIAEHVYEEDKELLRPAVSECQLRQALTEKPICSVNYRTVCGGEVRYFQIKAARVGEWSKRHDIVLGVRSVDEETRSDREKNAILEGALAQANRASRAKTTFLSNMSHDIRTPMNAIIGFTNLAVIHIDNQEQVKEYLQKIMTSGNHLLGLINDILDMSRIESGKVHLEEKPCSLPDILYELRSIIQGDASAKNLELRVSTENIRHEEICGDRLRLNQILLNLLSNAVKYTPAGGMVSLSISEKDGAPPGFANYEFHVKDTGIGMSEAFVANIFEPFERERNSTISGIQGTGLGMAITKNLVDMMGGTITVKSQRDVGTECTVSLTLSLHSGEDASASLGLKGARALVAGADLSTCNSVTAMLQQMELEAEWTMSGEEAVLFACQAAAQGKRHQLYIIDRFLPDINGIEVARRIRREADQDVPILLLSSFDWADIEDKAREVGVTAFCGKPLFFSELRRCVCSILSPEEPQEDGPSQQKAHRTGRILLAEDNELNQEIATAILEEAGFLVEVAGDGRTAVDMLKASEPGYYQVILMDIQMPVMGGHEAAQEIRGLENRELASIPILAMTANAFEEDKQAALRSGMNGHVAKPIDIDVLMQTLDEILN